jgi:ribosomal protein L11 methyltransferase
LCFEFGAGGVEEQLDFVQPDLVFDPQIIKKDRHDLNVYFEMAPNPEFSEIIKSKFDGIKIELFEEENKDWMEEWKKG